MNSRTRWEKVNEILEFLNQKRVRCTYGAVGEIIGVLPRSVSVFLGERRKEASWVVSLATGLPTGYAEEQWHKDLLKSQRIIKTGYELRNEIEKWKADGI